MTGATVRQLQWWDERGFIKAGRKPSTHGHKDRAYTESQVNQIARLMEIRVHRKFPFGKNTALLKKILNSGYPIRVIHEPTVIGGELVVPL